MQYSQEHLKTMVYAEFGGQTECFMGNSKIENGWRLNSGFWNLNYCPFPLNRGVSSKEVTISKII